MNQVLGLLKKTWTECVAFRCGGARPGGAFFWKVSLTTWFVKQHYFHICVFCWWFRGRCINSIYITWRKTNRLRWSESWCLLSEMVTSSVWRRFRGSLSIFFCLSVCVLCLLFLHVIGGQIAEMNYACAAIWLILQSYGGSTRPQIYRIWPRVTNAVNTCEELPAISGERTKCCCLWDGNQFWLRQIVPLTSWSPNLIPL